MQLKTLWEEKENYSWWHDPRVNPGDPDDPEIWLEKVRSYIEKLEKALVDLEIPERMEMYEQLESLKGFKVDAEAMSRKLKAVEDWFESEKGYNIPGFEKLEEILK